jgi:enoyl-CoA hydratase
MNEIAASETEDILFARRGRLGHVLLNRPRALNALTHAMSIKFDAALRAWASDPAVETVCITGAGDRAFCAGGDVRALYQAGPGGRLTRDFYWDEYRLNRRIHRYPKPYVALIDGIAMGGGVGVSVPGRFRVVSEKALFAMPETGIGLFPDVGGTYFLSRCPGEIGVYLGLTGARLKAVDLVYAGLATHHVPSERLGELLSALESEPAEAALDRFAESPGHPPLAAQREAIDRCFAGESIEDILDALDREGSAWAKATRDALMQKSPTSLRVSLRQLRAGRELDFEECMRLEYRLVRRFMAGHDFFEGVRAVVVDKDNKPRWRPAQLADVTPAMVDPYFASLGAEELAFDD